MSSRASRRFTKIPVGWTWCQLACAAPVVAFRAVASDGRKVTTVRTYRGCKKGRPHTKIKKRHHR